MSNFKNILTHLRTVKEHRKAVRRLCIGLGLVWQGLTHDLSKYSPTELKIAKYATGKRSPHEVYREVKGQPSPAWNHHYHKNKHHWQFYVDEMENATSAKMPYKYVVEMFCDMTAASKTYLKDKFKSSAPFEYYKEKSQGLRRFMHQESQALLVLLFERYSEMSEQEFFKWYKQTKKMLKNNY